jgi:hypothetical protein
MDGCGGNIKAAQSWGIYGLVSCNVGEVAVDLGCDKPSETAGTRCLKAKQCALFPGLGYDDVWLGS